MVSATTNLIESYGKMTAGSFLYNPIMQAYFNTVSKFTPNTDKPVWEMAHSTVTDYKTCKLVTFSRNSDKPPMLIIAPISGHYATLLTDTVKRLSEDYNVYITDWKNVRDTPEITTYGLDDYVQELAEIIKECKSTINILAICQGCVPTLRAINEYRCEINTLTLLAGPIDTRKGRTSINEFCDNKDIAWFEKNTIQTVPKDFASAGAQVYPGFAQLAGFMSMNMSNHVNKFFDHFKNTLKGEDTTQTENFYAEYMAVMDLPAKFYLDTINTMFLNQKHLEKDFKHIKCPIYVVEGKHDDICGLGQTIAISNHVDVEVIHYIANAGHYGCFSGSVWRNEIAPRIGEFTSCMS